MPATNEQRATNLKEANRIKKLRVDLKSEVHRCGVEQGPFILADAIEDLPDWLEGQDAWDLLTWSPRTGEGSAEGMMHHAGVAGPRRMRELSLRQRSVLADCLRTGSQRWAKAA